MIEKFENYTDSGDVSFEEETQPEIKERKCLKCREVFPSQWAGERICKRCKSSGSWRNGSV
ncbi:MAG: hypothetical protein CL567_04505 [Alphaproteobacteria bacterium]|nr:hypothetical protein [Alphaproteobacteria bacterium]|tara:strand:- start:3870 stop:4052 length:183 start_codon:yes stop_codon:yes gene_type:complete